MPSLLHPRSEAWVRTKRQSRTTVRECDYEQYKAWTPSAIMHLITVQTIALTNETKQSRSP